MSIPIEDIIENKLFLQFAYGIRNHNITSSDFERRQGAYCAWFRWIPDFFEDTFDIYIKLEYDSDNFILTIEDKILKKKYIKTGTNPLTLILDFAAIVKKAILKYNRVDEEWAKWGF